MSFLPFFAIITVRVLDPDAALSSKVVKQLSEIVRFCSRLPITTTYWVLVLTYFLYLIQFNSRVPVFYPEILEDTVPSVSGSRSMTMKKEKYSSRADKSPFHILTKHELPA